MEKPKYVTKILELFESIMPHWTLGILTAEVVKNGKSLDIWYRGVAVFRIRRLRHTIYKVHRYSDEGQLLSPQFTFGDWRGAAKYCIVTLITEKIDMLFPDPPEELDEEYLPDDVNN